MYEENYPQILGLLLEMDVDIAEYIDMEGRTLLDHVAQLVLSSTIDRYKSLDDRITRTLRPWKRWPWPALL